MVNYWPGLYDTEMDAFTASFRYTFMLQKFCCFNLKQRKSIIFADKELNQTCKFFHLWQYIFGLSNNLQTTMIACLRNGLCITAMSTAMEIFEVDHLLHIQQIIHVSAYILCLLLTDRTFKVDNNMAPNVILVWGPGSQF